MSEENIEAIRAVYEGFSEGDFRASLRVVDPLVLPVMPPQFPDAGTHLGLERFAEFRGDKAIRLENFRERSDAFEAAGLPE